MAGSPITRPLARVVDESAATALPDDVDITIVACGGRADIALKESSDFSRIGTEY